MIRQLTKQKYGRIFTGIGIVIAFFSCAKNETEEHKLKSTEYYTYSVGNLREYDVDSIVYFGGAIIKRFHFLVKETVTDTFTDLQGDPALRIEQYISKDTGKNYNFHALNVVKWNTYGFQRVENNQRYLKVSIPIADSKKWNGNQFNSLGDQDFQYAGVEKAHANQYLSFSDCIYVSELNDTSVISADKKTSVYASGYGLVYKMDRKLQYPNFNDPQGYVMEWKLRNYEEK